MKINQLLLVVFVLSTLIGCKSTERVVREENKQQAKEQSIYTSQNDITLTEFAQQIKNSKNQHFRFVFYDTEKPITKETGKPPLLMEGELTDKGIVEENTDIQSNEQSNIKQNETVIENEDTSLKDTSDIAKNKKTVVEQTTGLLWAIISLILVGVVLFAFIKWKKKKII